MNDLEKLLAKKSVALVGPSPHLVGKRLGNKIDSFDIVIRVNEILSTQNTIDFGSRTDAVFVNLNNDYLETFKKMLHQNQEEVRNVKLFISPRNSLHVSSENRIRMDENENIFNNSDKLGISERFFHIGDKKNNALEKKVGTYPSTGLLALMILEELKIEELFICGFSFYSTSKMYNPERTRLYKQNGHRLDGFGGHDIISEIKYLQKYFPQNSKIKVDFIFNLLIYKKIPYRAIKYLNNLRDFFHNTRKSE